MAKYQINYEAIDSDERKNNGIPYADFLMLAETVIGILLVAVLVFTFVFKTMSVSGDSMSPTIENADRVIINNMKYTPEVGDVVAIDSFALGSSKLRRIVAKGGDTVKVDYNTGKLTVNGTEVEESYLAEYPVPEILGKDFEMTVPGGQYFVLCDNRSSFQDSRNDNIGCISADQIKGKAVCTIFPLSSIGAIGNGSDAE